MGDGAGDKEVTDVLPVELTGGAELRGREYAWQISSFTVALKRAPGLGYACLGGQFQLRLGDSIYEMYWLSADSTDRNLNEEWETFARRSCNEVLSEFDRLLAASNFDVETEKFEALISRRNSGEKVASRLVFNAYFVTEDEWKGLNPSYKTRTPSS